MASTVPYKEEPTPTHCDKSGNPVPTQPDSSKFSVQSQRITALIDPDDGYVAHVWYIQTSQEPAPYAGVDITISSGDGTITGVLPNHQLYIDLSNQGGVLGLLNQSEDTKGKLAEKVKIPDCPADSTMYQSLIDVTKVPCEGEVILYNTASKGEEQRFQTPLTIMMRRFDCMKNIGPRGCEPILHHCLIPLLIHHTWA